MSRQTAIVLVLLSALGFGSMAMFAKVAYAAGVTPTMLLALRFVLATALLAPLVWWKKLALPRGRMLAGYIGMGVLYTAQSLSYFNGLLHASSGLIGLLLYAYPAIVTILEVMLGWERLDRRTFALLALAIAGMGVTLGGDLKGEPLGILFGLACAFIYSGYIILGAHLTRRGMQNGRQNGRQHGGQHVDPLAGTLVILASAALGNTALALGGNATLPASASAWLAVLAIALFSTVMAIAFILIGIKVIGGAKASIISTLEPVITIILGAAVFGETVGASQLLGGAMVLAAVIMLSQKPPLEAQPQVCEAIQS